MVMTTWESFRDAIKEQYYHVESYDDLYTKWTTLWQERDQAVPKFTNIFHTLRPSWVSKIQRDIWCSSIAVLFIDTSRLKWNFCTSFPWGRPTDISSKLIKSSNKKHDNLGLGTPHSKSQEGATPTHRKKEKEKMDNIMTTSPSCKQIRTPERQRKIPRSGVTSIRDLGITLLTTSQSSHWWSK
jgi:hypothetical protein